MPFACARCGSDDESFCGWCETAAYCEACDRRYGCTCCHGDAAQCGCTFLQTGKLYYDCQQHHTVVRIVADIAPIKQGDYFRL